MGEYCTEPDKLLDMTRLDIYKTVIKIAEFIKNKFKFAQYEEGVFNLAEVCASSMLCQRYEARRKLVELSDKINKKDEQNLPMILENCRDYAIETRDRIPEINWRP